MSERNLISCSPFGDQYTVRITGLPPEDNRVPVQILIQGHYFVEPLSHELSFWDRFRI